MVNINTIAQDCLDIVRDITPHDTGNLAFNATVLRFTTTGFSIIVIDDKAPYVVYVNGNQNYWGRAHSAVAGYMTGVLTGEKNNINATKESVALRSPSTPERELRMLQSMSNVSLK